MIAVRSLKDMHLDVSGILKGGGQLIFLVA